jgi:small subunit ribosomal protein S2
MPTVTERWIGGTLTNFSVIRSRLRRLEDLEKMEEDGSVGQYSKKVISSLRREQRKILRNLAGIREMTSIPGAMVVVDPSREENAIKEAKKMGLVVIGILDTDCDPEGIDIVIPGNDDALRSVRLLIETLAKAVEEGAATHRERMAATGAAERTDDQPMSDEPRPTRNRPMPRQIRSMRPLAPSEDDEGGEERGARRVDPTATAVEPTPETPAE